MVSLDTKEKVQNSINQLIEDLQTYPHKYLTEDDVRIHLCSRLLKYFGHIEETKDGSESIALHSEVRWFGEDKYSERSDIVIFDVSDFEVTKENVRSIINAGLAPRKGYASNSPVAVIELKLRRILSESDIEYINLLNRDFDKLARIKTMMDERGKQEINYWLVELDKANNLNYEPREEVERIHVDYSFSS